MYIRRSTLSKVYLYCICIFILYSCDSVYSYVYGSSDNIVEFLVLSLMFSLAIKIKWNKKKLNFLCKSGLLSLFIFIHYIYNYSKGNDHLYVLLLIVRLLATTCLMIWSYERKYNIWQIFSNIVFYIALIYLICYLVFDIGPLNKFGEIKSIYIQSQDRYSMYHVFGGFYYRWDMFKRTALGSLYTYRVNGFFRECGVYQIYLNFALIIELFTREKINKLKILILSLSVLTAGSTMGYLVYAFIVSAKLFSQKMARKTLVVPIIGVLLVLSYRILMFKFDSGAADNRIFNVNNATTLVRMFWPVGQGYSASNISYYGILNYLIHFGIFGLFPLFVVFRTTLNKYNDNFWMGIAFLGWWIGSVANEACGYNIFFVMTIVFCLYRRRNDEYKKQEES